jgi:GxxExxY protein
MGLGSKHDCGIDGLSSELQRAKIARYASSYCLSFASLRLCVRFSLDGDRRKGVGMTENQIAKEVVDAAYHVHTRLGLGLLESVYEVVLSHELKKRGLKAARQVAIPVVYDSITFEEGFRADIIVEDKVIVELKSVESVSEAHKKQLLTYLRLADKRLGLLINFGEELIRDGISRVVNGLTEQ